MTPNIADPQFREDSFTHVLIGDVTAVQERLHQSDTQSHRRDLIRTVSSALEGLLWQLRQNVLRYATASTRLSPHEFAALNEETYLVDDRGQVRTQARYLPLPSAIRLVVAIVQKYKEQYSVDFQHSGWNNLVATVRTRNRLVHPKKLSDLKVSEKEISQAMSGFCWFLALAIEIGDESKQHIDTLLSMSIAAGEEQDADA